MYTCTSGATDVAVRASLVRVQMGAKGVVKGQGGTQGVTRGYTRREALCPLLSACI
jgi:hypothetical protein